MIKRTILLCAFIIMSLNLTAQRTMYKNNTNKSGEELCEERGHIWVYEIRDAFPPKPPINKLVDDSLGTYRVSCGGYPIISVCERCGKYERSYKRCDTTWIYSTNPFMKIDGGDLDPKWLLETLDK